MLPQEAGREYECVTGKFKNRITAAASSVAATDRVDLSTPCQLPAGGGDAGILLKVAEDVAASPETEHLN